MGKFIQSLFVFFLFCTHCVGEPSLLLSNFFQTWNTPTRESLSEYLDKNIGMYIGDIKKLSRTNERRVLFLNLKAALGHPKKRKNILFRDSSSGKLRRDAVPAHPWRKVRFKDTLKAAMMVWIQEEQFAQNHPDLSDLFVMLFGQYGAKKTNANLANTLWALYPNRSGGKLKYYPWPLLLDPERIDHLEMLYVTKGVNIKNAFGHAALLVVMSPSDGQPLEREANKMDNQYVISFRAYVPEEEALQPMKAVSGHYRSIMYFEPISDFLSSYMFKEERAVLRLPLNLTRNQIHAFVANLARKQLDSSYYRFFSTNCATEMLTMFQAIVPHGDIFTNPLSPDALIQLLVRCDVIRRDLWLERDLSFEDLMLREADGLAYVPPLKEKKFFIAKMKKKIEKHGIEFPDEDIFERIFYGAEKRRLQFYQHILSELLQRNKNIDILVKTMLFIEQQIEKEIMFELLGEASHSQDPLFLGSEQEVEEQSRAVARKIEEQRSNLFQITTQNERYAWYQEEGEVQEILRNNWQIKLSLPLNANERIREQRSINAFLSGLIALP